MVLVSIHPFALRRLFLVVLALAGFSALCFADPVLMARRYNPNRFSIAKVPSMPTLRLNLTEAIGEHQALNAMIGFEKGENPASATDSVCSGVPAWDVRRNTPTAITLLSLEATALN